MRTDTSNTNSQLVVSSSFLPTNQFGIDVINAFWNCSDAGVNVSGYYNVIGKGSNMVSNHRWNDGSSPNYGYKIQLNQTFYNIQLDNNWIANVSTGIYVGMAVLPFQSQYFYCTMDVSHNDVRNCRINGYSYSSFSNSVWGPAGGMNNRYTNKCIDIESITFNPHFYGILNMSTNNTQGFNGIIVNGTPLTTLTDNSFVTLFKVPPLNSNTPQFGIQHTNMVQNQITNTNELGGGEWTMVNPFLTDNIKGIFVSQCSQPSVTCNAVDPAPAPPWANQPVGRGIEFAGNQLQPNTNFRSNLMFQNLKGYVLNNTQLTNTSLGNVNDPIENLWVGFTSPNYETFVYANTTNYYAINSKMYIRNVPGCSYNLHPTLNGYQLPPPPPYLTGDASYNHINAIITTGGIPHPCIMGCSNTAPSAPAVNTNIDISGYNDIAKYTTTGYIFDDKGAWMSQFALWKILQMKSISDTDTVVITCPNLIPDSTLDSNLVIKAFKDLGANSRFKYLTDIEEAINTSNFAGARAMMAISMAPASFSDPVTGATIFDASTVNDIVSNYLSYYDLVIKYQQDSLNSGDSNMVATIAGWCPNYAGTVVLHARALYTMIYGDQTTWDDDSVCNSLDSMLGRKVQPHNSATPESMAENFTIYPNPAQNNVAIAINKGMWSNSDIVEAYDMTGRQMAIIIPEANSNSIDINTSSWMPGVYMIVIKQSNGKKTTQKLVIEK